MNSTNNFEFLILNITLFTVDSKFTNQIFIIQFYNIVAKYYQ